MFARQRDPGLWTFDSVITGAELEYWDASIANALDGEDGGAYSLQNDMVIGGAGPFTAWVFDLETSFNAYSSFTANVVFGDDVTFLADTAFHEGVTIGMGGDFDLFTINAYSEFNGDVLTHGPVGHVGPVHFYDETAFDGDALFNGGVTFEAFLNADGNVFLGGPGFVELIGATTVRAPVGFADAGKVKWRSQTITSAGDQSIVAAQVDTVLIPDGVMASGNSLEISDTGAADGMRVRFKTQDNANVVYVRAPGGSALNGGLVVGANTTTWIDVERIDGFWRLTGAGRDAYT